MKKVALFAVLSVVFVICLSNQAVSAKYELYVVSNNTSTNPILEAYDVVGTTIDLDSTYNLTLGIGNGPIGVALDDMEDVLYVTYEATNKIYVYDATNFEFQYSVAVPGVPDGWPGLAGIVVDTKRNRLYVVERCQNTLYVFDSSVQPIVYLDEWPLTGFEDDYGPLGLALDTVDNKLYATSIIRPCVGVTGPTDNKVFVYDLAAAAAHVNTYAMGGSAAGVAVDDDGSPGSILIYTTSLTTGPYEVRKYDTSLPPGNAQVLSFDDSPTGIAVHCPTDLVYVTVSGWSCGTPTIRVIDGVNMTVVYTENLTYGWVPTDLCIGAVPFGAATVKIPNKVYERFGFGHWDYEGEIILDDACPPWNGVNPGDFFEIPIILENFGPSYPVGGFELEVEFDYIDLTFYGAMRGILLEQRGFYPTELDTFFSWEYFAYRVLPCPLCACCKYKILLYGQAEMPDGAMRKGYCLSTSNDWPYTYWAVDSTTGSYPEPEGGGCCQFPDGCCSCEYFDEEQCVLHGGVPYPGYGCNEETGLCGPPDQEEIGATLVWLKFQVANNELLRDLKLPIFFEWEHKLYPDRYEIWEDWDCAENTMSDCEGNVLYVSSNDLDEYDPDVCPAGENILTILEFVDGGVHICSPCTSFYCVRGDINVNEIAYETADAVLFARYFVYGLSVFNIDRDNQICATDVNADGRTLMLADLIYLIRVIQRDAVPFSKLGPSADVANLIVSDGRVSVECASEIGGLLFEFDATVTPSLLADMELLAKEGKVLVWSSEGKSIEAGISDVMTFAGAELVSVTAVDREGRDLATSIAGKLRPSAFALYPAYPNPFNPYTNLSFSLPIATAYTMKIYNVAGQLVRSYEGMGVAGLNAITWDGKDYFGNEVASGVYFYRLMAGQYRAIKKMVMLK